MIQDILKAILGLVLGVLMIALPVKHAYKRGLTEGKRLSYSRADTAYRRGLVVGEVFGNRKRDSLIYVNGFKNGQKDVIDSITFVKNYK